MKKLILSLLGLLLLVGMSEAALLSHVRFGYYPDKIRLVFDLNDCFAYESNETKEKISLTLKNTEASAEIQSIIELNDFVLRHMEVEKDGDDLRISIPLAEPVNYSIYTLDSPPRLVIDFERDYINIVSGGLVGRGVELLKVKKGSAEGQINANVLKIDLSKTEIKPALGKKKKTDFISSFFSLITPWNKKTGRNLTLAHVTDIVSENGATAGINGTFFESNGTPLGLIMIDQELISSPIYDRTAFFLDEQNRPYIDNVFVASSFSTKNGSRYQITGINQAREENDLILYTPVWGESTQTNRQGVEFIISNSTVVGTGAANSKIPEDGFVLSANGTACATLLENIKPGETIALDLKVVPYNTAPNKIIHLISGGPRLIKDGEIYVSKYEERFKSDIARGKAARTAIGINKEGKILLVTVDGRARNGKNKGGVGASLEELSDLLISLGAEDAMNLDGGSSTTMVVNGEVINVPTGGYERRVSNALVVFCKD